MTTEQTKPTSHYLSQFFTYAHLPAHLAEISKPFCELAEKILGNMTSQGEEIQKLIAWIEVEFGPNEDASWAQTKLADAQRMLPTGLLDQGLRKVLEAKDCAVRARLAGAYKGPR